VDEATQVSPRQPEVLDWVADVIGASAGVVLFSVFSRLRTSTSPIRQPAE